MSSPRYRLKRDITERERDLVGVLQQYNTFVKPVGILYAFIVFLMNVKFCSSMYWVL